MKSHCHSGGACAGLDPVAGVQTTRINKIKEIWIPAFAGMTLSMFIYEFSRSLIHWKLLLHFQYFRHPWRSRGKDDVRSKLRGIEPSEI